MFPLDNDAPSTARMLVHAVALIVGAAAVAEPHMAMYGQQRGLRGSYPPPAAPTLPAGRAQHPPYLTLVERNGTRRRTRTLAGNTTALVVIDMWSYHPCKTVTNRAASLVPRLNLVAAAIRRAGGTIIFAPTDAAETYAGWPQRENALAAPRVPLNLSNASFPSIPGGTVVGHNDEVGSSLPRLHVAPPARVHCPLTQSHSPPPLPLDPLYSAAHLDTAACGITGRLGKIRPS